LVTTDHTFSFHPHLVSVGHRRVHPHRSGTSTAPQRLQNDKNIFEQVS